MNATEAEETSASSKQLRVIFDSAPSAIVTIDETGDIVEWNQAATNLFQWPRHEAIRKKMHELIIPHRLREAHLAGCGRYHHTRQGRFIGKPIRVPALRRDGTEVSVELVVTQSNATPLLLTAFITDITAIWRMEDEVKAADEMKQALFTIMERSGIILFTKDKEGRFEHGNGPLLDLLGPDTPLIGRTVSELFSPEDAEVMNRDERELYLHPNAEPQTVEESMNIQDQRRTYLVTRTCRRNGQSTVDGLYGLSIDITDYKKAILAASESEKKQLQLSAQLALASNKAKTDFLANMSHEIRTPVNGIVGFTSLLKDTHPTEEQQELIEGILTASGALMSIINDILDISKIEAGRVELEMMDCDLSSLIKDLCAMFNYMVKGKNLTIDVKVELPPEVSKILFDPGRLRQVLNNLLSNSVKFTFEGEITLRIAYRSQNSSGGGDAPSSSGGDIYFEISDTGIGIPEDKQSTLFRPFTQAETSTTRRFGGTGLGLSISKNLVELMGGKIDFHSVPQQGTTFHFTIPYLPAVEANIEDFANAERSDSDDSSHSKSRFILLVDDNRTNLKLTTKMLEKGGYNVSASENGAEAVSLLQTFPNRYGLVLMDCQMPVMDGYEATQCIRDLPEPLHSIPIVAMTANALKGERERCVELGMNDYVSKPVDRAILMKKVRKWLG